MLFVCCSFVCVCLCLSLFGLVGLFACFCVCLVFCSYVCLFVCLCVCLFVGLFVCLCVCLFVCLLVCVLCLFVCLFLCLFVCLFVRLFVCLFVCFPVGVVWRVPGEGWDAGKQLAPPGQKEDRRVCKVEVREGSEKVNKPEKHRVNFSGS